MTDVGLIGAFFSQAALVIERAYLAAEAQKALLNAEGERLGNSFERRLSRSAGVACHDHRLGEHAHEFPTAAGRCTRSLRVDSPLYT
jgi:hypothetical protein